MPDFRGYIRQHLPPLRISGAQEAEIVEEIAIEFEERYERAIQGGLTPEEALGSCPERSGVVARVEQ
jgi:hypothetical protein